MACVSQHKDPRLSVGGPRPAAHSHEAYTWWEGWRRRDATQGRVAMGTALHVIAGKVCGLLLFFVSKTLECWQQPYVSFRNPLLPHNAGGPQLVSSGFSYDHRRPTDILVSVWSNCGSSGSNSGVVVDSNTR